MVEDGFKVQSLLDKKHVYSLLTHLLQCLILPGKNSPVRVSAHSSTLTWRLFLDGFYNPVCWLCPHLFPASPPVAKAVVTSQPSSYLVYQKYFPSLTSIHHPLWVLLSLPAHPPVLSMPSSEVPGVLSSEFLSCGKPCLCLGYLLACPVSLHASFSHPT